MITEKEFIKLFIEKLKMSGKHPQQDITGWRAIETIKEVFKELGERVKEVKNNEQ